MKIKKKKTTSTDSQENEHNEPTGMSKEGFIVVKTSFQDQAPVHLFCADGKTHVRTVVRVALLAMRDTVRDLD